MGGRYSIGQDHSDGPSKPYTLTSARASNLHYVGNFKKEHMTLQSNNQQSIVTQNNDKPKHKHYALGI